MIDIQRNNKRFCAAIAIGYLFVLPYPICMFLTLDSAEAWLWLKQIPAKSFFNLSVMPLTFALLVEMISAAHYKKLENLRKFFIVAALIVLSYFSFHFIFITDLVDRPISPYMLKVDADRKAALSIFHSTREDYNKVIELKKEWQDARIVEKANPGNAVAKKAASEADVAYNKANAAYLIKVARYKKLTDPPLTYSSYWARANCASHTTVLLNIFGAIQVVLFFNFLFVRLHSRMSQRMWERLLLVAILLGIWFPLRIYSNWFENEHIRPEDPADIMDYFALIMLFISWNAAILILIVFKLGSNMLKMLSGIQTVAAFGIGAAAFYAPAAFVGCFHFLNNLPLAVFLGGFFIFFIVQVFIVERIRRLDSEQDDAATSSKQPSFMKRS